MAAGGELHVALVDLIALLNRFRTAPNTPFILRFGLSTPVSAIESQSHPTAQNLLPFPCKN